MTRTSIKTFSQPETTNAHFDRPTPENRRGTGAGNLYINKYPKPKPPCPRTRAVEPWIKIGRISWPRNTPETGRQNRARIHPNRRRCGARHERAGEAVDDCATGGECSGPNSPFNITNYMPKSRSKCMRNLTMTRPSRNYPFRRKRPGDFTAKEQATLRLVSGENHELQLNQNPKTPTLRPPTLRFSTGHLPEE